MAPVLDLLPIYLLFETGVGGKVMKYRGVHLGLNAGDGYQRMRRWLSEYMQTRSGKES